ncbi:C2 domain containing protein, putative [Leishmania lindenbergi]|uniref:C2 domain containing protein n=1 Tax=Leishmania lindenbergi TaxID=651832 RepID=A0AAW3A143_9TRYP
MSIFGEPLPFEDDTATSLIRRSGFPPEKAYAQMPEVYLCPCCSEFSKQQEHERLLREAREVKEAEYRRLMQLDVFEERARPPPSSDIHRKAYRRIVGYVDLDEEGPNVPPPPTIDELRRARNEQSVPKLVVTVHFGRGISAEPEDRISVIVRCGAFEGQTEKVLRGKEVATPWEELFEFPYMNSNEPLEVLVVNDALPESNDQLIGGLMIPSNILHDRSHGDQEPLPVMPEDRMQNGYGTCQDGPLGTIVASWYVRYGDDKLDEGVERQKLSVPVTCTFVVHHVFQYTDHGAESYPGGVLCVLRDTDDNCSESVLYTPGPHPEPSLSSYYTKEGYHYFPQNASQLMQLNTEKKLGHILVCVPRQEESTTEEEELLVIGAVPLEFERLYSKGSAVLLIESKSKDDVLWGEISVEWANKPLDEEDPRPLPLEVQKESLFVTIVRGLNLMRRDSSPVEMAYVSVATGELEGITVEAPAVKDADGNYTTNWNQEVRFVEVESTQKELELQVYEKGCLVSVGTCELEDTDEGVVVVQLFNAANPSDGAGEIVVSYKRLHVPKLVEEAVPQERRLVESEVDEEDEEIEEQEAPFAGHADDYEDQEEEEEEEDEYQGMNAAPMNECAMSINEEISGEEEADNTAQEKEFQWQNDRREYRQLADNEDEEQQGYLEEAEQQECLEDTEQQGYLEEAEQQECLEDTEQQGYLEGAEQQECLEDTEQQGYLEGAEQQECLEDTEQQGYLEGAEQQECLEGAEQQEAAEAGLEGYLEEEEPAGECAVKEPAPYPVRAARRPRRRTSWAVRPPKDDYVQPWYPSGAPDTDQHIPFAKTRLSKKNIESIRQLEVCKSRIEEESVRRSSTPRRSSLRGLSPSSQ